VGDDGADTADGISSAADYDAAFAKMTQARVDGALVHASALTARNNLRHLAALALKHGCRPYTAPVTT
jgi:hypothetical protein